MMLTPPTTPWPLSDRACRCTSFAFGLDAEPEHAPGFIVGLLASSDARLRPKRRKFLKRLIECPHDASSSSNALASFKSSVSKPSVNQPYAGTGGCRPWLRFRAAHAGLRRPVDRE